MSGASLGWPISILKTYTHHNEELRVTGAKPGQECQFAGAREGGPPRDPMRDGSHGRGGAG